MSSGSEAHVSIHPVRIPVFGVTLDGDLAIPEGASGLVIFAHGTGSSRHSPRNKHVAGILHSAGLATLLMDLLTQREEGEDLRTAQLRFDIGFLAGRLVGATDWARGFPATRDMSIGYFGASTGAAAAMVAAADRADVVRAVVSRGGRPDLAGDHLDKLCAPTLLIVGSKDDIVLKLNRLAMERMNCPKELAVVEGATHLFEEPGALNEVGRLASRWFTRHLSGAAARLGAASTTPTQ